MVSAESSLDYLDSTWTPAPRLTIHVDSTVPLYRKISVVLHNMDRFGFGITHASRTVADQQFFVFVREDDEESPI